MTALTYEEAHERSQLIDVLEYRVELDVTGGDDVFGSVTVVRFGCRAPGAASFIEIRPTVATATLRAGERCLESGGLARSLRRLLSDQLEDLRRSLAVSSAG